MSSPTSVIDEAVCLNSRVTNFCHQLLIHKCTTIEYSPFDHHIIYDSYMIIWFICGISYTIFAKVWIPLQSNDNLKVSICNEFWAIFRILFHIHVFLMRVCRVSLQSLTRLICWIVVRFELWVYIADLDANTGSPL